MITRLRNYYSIDKIVWEEDRSCDVLDPVFLMAFEAVPNQLDGHLARYGWTMDLRCVSAVNGHPDANDEYLLKIKQNYYSALPIDPECKVLEAAFLIDNESKWYIVGVPVAFIPEPDKMHTFVFYFDGVHLRMLCDGYLMDQDFPTASPIHYYPDPHAGIDKCTISVLSDAVQNLRISNDLDGLEITSETWEDPSPAHLYMPANYNDWAGDVATAYYKGRLHVFYLYDRRHHGSRMGRGAHEFHHLSSANLRDWTEHGPVVPIEESWQTIGTGNAFVWNDRLHIAYGLHTERARSYQDTANHLFLEHLAFFGNTGSFRFNEIGKLTPGGASYYYSDDGINFKPSKRLIHFMENPSVRVMPDNTLTVTQVGVWASDHLGDWTLKQSDFPPKYEKSFARNCLDCPNYFDLGGWEYLVVGFTGFFGHPQGTSEWTDFTKNGWDTYDGTNVPMYATLPDGRVIECGWAAGMENSWASQLLFREMVALGDGRIGKRWVPETLPEFAASASIGDSVNLEDHPQLSMFEFTIDAGQGTGAVSFMFESRKGGAAEIQVDVENGRAQVSLLPEAKAPFAVRQETLQESLLNNPGVMSFQNLPTDPRRCVNYAIGKLIGLKDSALKVRILMDIHAKNQGTLLDCEIAGHHTMFLRCDDFTPDSLKITPSEPSIRITEGKMQK